MISSAYTETPTNASSLLSLEQADEVAGKPTHGWPLNDDGHAQVSTSANSLYINPYEQCYTSARKLMHTSLLDDEEAQKTETFVDLLWDLRLKSTRRSSAAGPVASTFVQIALLCTIFDYITCYPDAHQINSIVWLIGGDSEQVCKWFADERKRSGHGDPGLCSLSNSTLCQYSGVTLRIVAHEFFQSWCWQFFKHSCLPTACPKEWESRESPDRSRDYYAHWSSCWFDTVVTLCWKRLVADQ